MTPFNRCAKRSGRPLFIICGIYQIYTSGQFWQQSRNYIPLWQFRASDKAQLRQFARLERFLACIFNYYPAMTYVASSMAIKSL